MAQKQPSWRCAACHVVMKGTFPRCWKCGQEWGQCSDPSFTPPDRRGQAYNQHQVQPPPWDGQQWHSSNSGSWSPRTRTRRSSNRGRKKGKGNGTWQDGDQMSHPKGTRQRYGATCTSTDTIAAFYAVSAHDAPVPAADDAGTFATTFDRQGCWQNKEFSCDDAHDAGGTTRSYDICCTDHAMGYSRTDDGTTSGTDRVFGYEFCGDIDWAQTGWTSTAKVEQIAQGDEEGRRQCISSSTSHRSRDAETKERKTISKTCPLQSKPWAMPSRTCSKPKMHGLSSCRNGSRSYKQSVVKWREFTANFQASESAHQQGVQAAKLEVRRAQRAFDLASKREQPGKEDTLDISDEEEDAEVTEEVMEDPHNESVQRIHQGMTSNCDELGGAVKFSRSARTARQAPTHIWCRGRCWWLACSSSRKSSCCSAAFWRGRCRMTSVYTHHGPFEWPTLDPDAVKLQWNYSILSERDFLSTWQAQEHASTLAAEVGASDHVEIDVFTLPKRTPSSTNRVRFDAEVVRFMWEDYIDNDAPFDVHIVNPTPPTTVFQGSIATVLITQHPVDDRAACVLTVTADDHFPQRIWQTARSTALITPYWNVIEDSGFGAECRVPDPLQQCSLWHGHRELPPDLDVHIHNGIGLTIRVPAQPHHLASSAMLDVPTNDVGQETEEDEDTALFMTGLQSHGVLPNRHDEHALTSIEGSDQTFIEGRVASACLPRDSVCTMGLNLPDGHSEGDFYQRDTTSHARPVPQWDPTAPDPFLQNLYTLWELMAFSWEDEPRSGIVLVWFVDHDWLEPHCYAPRAVQLFPAIQEWRLRIWQAWADVIVPGVQLDFHLVTPKPPTVDHRVIAHILLVQRPQPRQATIVISCFDARQPQPGSSSTCCHYA